MNDSGKKPPQSAEELLEQYEQDERDFRSANLSDAKFINANLNGANLSDAKFINANLSGANLSRAKLSRAKLSRAKLINANLRNANLDYADLKNADLSRADLDYADLDYADLDYADLNFARFWGANLRGAYLGDANLSRAKLINANLSRAKLINANLSDANLKNANLKNANLSGANLSGANLSDANLSDANLSDADLSGANLSDANLKNANLSDANLRSANLNDAKLINANLRSANLSGADLRSANLSGANLRNANLKDANLKRTALTNIDLTAFCNQPLSHYSLSSVDWQSVARSLKAPGLLQFLVDIGMPLIAATYLIDSLRSIDEMELFSMLQSVFLSYGHPDEPFAIKLRNALKQNGVMTWFFPDDAEPGQRLHREMSRNISSYDRMILVCSEASLTRPGVLYEIEEALDRERREGGGDIIIPIRIDGYVLGDWAPNRPNIMRSIQAKVVANFRDTENNEEKFNAMVQRLLCALRKPS